MIRYFVPDGLRRAYDWKGRFEAIGLSPVAAWRAAASRAMHEALVVSRIEHLPRAVRSRLSLVVDVGANVGQWISALRRFVAIEQVQSFEPNPEAFTTLRARLGHEPGISLHNVALGASAETLTLKVTASSDMSSLLHPRETLGAHYSPDRVAVLRQVQVPVKTLDSVLPADTLVDLLKIDVEGYERPVLQGAADTLKRTCALLIEMKFISHYAGDDTFASLASFLSDDCGLEFWDLAPPHRALDGRALWADVVYVNPRLEPETGWRGTGLPKGE